MKKDWMPSDAELSKFDRVVDAVDNPFSIIYDLQEGKLTRDKVQAVQTVYPKLYEGMSKRVVDSAIKNGLDHLTYNQRLQVGILLNSDEVDSGLAHIADLQLSYQTLESFKDADGNLPPEWRGKVKGFDASSSTELQKIESRKTRA